MRLRGWLASRRRKPFYLLSLAVLGLVLLGLDWYQQWTIAEYFAPLRATNGSDEAFALACNARVHEIHRNFESYLQATHLQDDADSFQYRLPGAIMNKGGLCAHRSLLLCIALRQNGIPARKLLIGVTPDYASHVVVEVWLDGKWRVLDPLFGYAYRRDDGQLATAENLKQDSSLVSRVVRADISPFPSEYPEAKYHYQQVMRFNWYKFSMLKRVHGWLGPEADEWEPLFVWNWTCTVIGYACLTLSAAGSFIFGCRAYRRARRSRKMLAEPVGHAG